jgi:phospholipase C
VPGSDILTQLVDSSYNPNNIPLPSGDATSAVSTTAANDDLKVQALINEINGKNSLGTITNGFSPAVFGMNFQSVSVGEKLTKDPNGNPGGITINPVTGQEILSANIKNGFSAADTEIGRIVAALKANNANPNLANFNNTLIIVTAKHGQNPRIGVGKKLGDPITPVLQAAGVVDARTQITEDDVALIWLNPANQASETPTALAALQNYAKNSPNQEIKQILSGTQLAAMGFGDPTKNSRTPDFIITLKPGFIYTSSSKKIAEHGGFSPDDTRVALIVAGGNAALAKGKVVGHSVSTKQIAVTTLEALGLDPGQLQGAVAENTAPLPAASPATPVREDLSIVSITHAPSSALIGNQESFTITIRNGGPGTVNSVTLTDKTTDSHNKQGFVAGTVNWTPSAGIYNAKTGFWALNLASGFTATLTVTGTVAANISGYLFNSATVVPGQGVIDPNFSNNSKSDKAILAQPVNVSISAMSDSVDQTGVPGSPVTFMFVVSNIGPNAANGVTVADPLVTGFLANSGSYTTSITGGATVTTPTGNNTNGINTTVNLPVNGSVTFTFTATIDPAFTAPSLSNTATVSLPANLANDPAANTSSTDTLSINPTADLAIDPIGDNSSNGDIAPGATITYNIFVTNNGPSSVVGATFTGSVDTQLTNVTFTGPNNSTPMAVTGGSFTDTIGLASRATVRYTVTGTVPSSGVSALSTSASIFDNSGVTADPDTSNNFQTDNTNVAQNAGAQGLANIQHFVVIYQENWSFDSLYGSFPGADGISNAATENPSSLNQIDRVNGQPISQESSYNPAFSYDPATMSNPPIPLDNNDNIDTRFTIIPGNPNSGAAVNTLQPYSLFSFIKPTDTTGDIVHRFYTEQSQIDGGNMDQFVTWSDNPGLVMSHFNATNLPEGLLAQQYTMDDNFFHAAYGGSFLNHQFLVAAQAPVYPNAPALLQPILDPTTGQLALNANGKIVQDGKITPIGSVSITNPNLTFDKNYAINTIFSANLIPAGKPGTTASTFGLLPSQNDNNPNAPNYIPTIGDTLNTAGMSWKWYSGGWNAALASSPSNPANAGKTPANPTVDSLFQWHHQPLAYFNNFAPWVNGQVNPMSAAHLQDETNFFGDLAANNLPAVSFIKQVGADNEHPGYANLSLGQQTTSDIVHAIQSSPEWANTAIIITYDENGGMWDHVSAPNANGIWGDGTRVPAIIISPYAQQGVVDHTQHDTLSILKTIENRFNLPPLSQYDAAASSLASSFTNNAHVDLKQAYAQPDAFNFGKSALIVQGTEGNDTIAVTQSGGNIFVTINGTAVGPAGGFAASSISRLEVYGLGGTDTITVDPSVTAPAFLFGGSGGGTIQAGGGPSVLVGGRFGATTQLSAGPNSILISGQGPSTVTSNNGSDILIAGTTAYDYNLAALEALLAEWSRNDISYQQKLTDLGGPNTVSGSKNGSYFLNASTVSSNKAHNTLQGGGNGSMSALDWFFANAANDSVLGAYSPEVTTAIS